MALTATWASLGALDPIRIAEFFIAFSYAFIEAIGGILMIAGLLTWIVAPVVLIATTLGAISITKAVYIDNRDLECACVGGGNKVPLGFLSLTENLMMMMAMPIWMMIKAV